MHELDCLQVLFEGCVVLEERDESELLENDEDFSLFVSEDKSIWFIGLLAPLFILILFMCFLI